VPAVEQQHHRQDSLHPSRRPRPRGAVAVPLGEPSGTRGCTRAAADQARSAVRARGSCSDQQCLARSGVGLLLWLTMVTGFRRGELCSLRWRHLDLERRLLWGRAQHGADLSRRRVREGHEETDTDRCIALDPETVQLLLVHPARASRRSAGVHAPGSTQTRSCSRSRRTIRRRCSRGTVTQQCRATASRLREPARDPRSPGWPSSCACE
jgi:integrase